MEIPVTEQQAMDALNVALQQLAKPYVWGGMGPDGFDCSGLILYAYKQVIPGFGILREGEKTNDANMMHLYDASKIVLLEDAVPGDIVFIAKTQNLNHITHGGLFVEVDSAGKVVFINASSYQNKVVIDVWDLDQTVREQKIVAFGRLKTAKQ